MSVTPEELADATKSFSRGYANGYSAGRYAQRARQTGGAITFEEIQQRGLDPDAINGLMGMARNQIDRQIHDLKLARRLMMREEMSAAEMTDAARAILEPHVQSLIREEPAIAAEPTVEAEQPTNA